MSIIANNIISNNIYELQKTITKQDSLIKYLLSKVSDSNSKKTGLRSTNLKRYIYSKKITFNNSPNSPSLPSSVNLTTLSYYPQVYNQGQIGSCTANGTAFCFQFDVLKKNPNDTFIPSRLFLYYFERILDYVNYNQYFDPPNISYPTLQNFNNSSTNNINGTPYSYELFMSQDTDSGSQDFEGINVLNLYGICDDKYWPYSDNPYVFMEFPINNLTNIINDCNNHKSKTFYPIGGTTIQYDGNSSFFFESGYVNDLSSIKTALSLGYPVVFGIALSQDTINALQNYPVSPGFQFVSLFGKNIIEQQYIINVPFSYTSAANKQQYIQTNMNEGHCIVIVGYDDSLQAFIIRNSWGISWGINGHFYLSYNYVSDPNLSNDFWVISDINDNNISINQ